MKKPNSLFSLFTKPRRARNMGNRNRRCPRRQLRLEVLEDRCLLSATLIDLGTLGGTTSDAYGINASGQVVGVSTTSNGYSHAFLYSGGSMTDLTPLEGFSLSSYALGINDSGQVVGWNDFQWGQPEGFLYSGGSMTDLGSLLANGSSSACCH